VGYRVGEVPIAIRDGDTSFAWSYTKGRLENFQPRSVSGVFGPGSVRERGVVPIARPRPDLKFVGNVVAGAQHRYACAMPLYDNEVVEDWWQFATVLFRRTYQPLPAGADVSVERWLDNAPYSAARKN